MIADCIKFSFSPIYSEDTEHWFYRMNIEDWSKDYYVAFDIEMAFETSECEIKLLEEHYFDVELRDYIIARIKEKKPYLDKIVTEYQGWTLQLNDVLA